MRKQFQIQKSPEGHWVGDGFPVRSIFSYHNMGTTISPFLLFDYGGPADFEPTSQRKGVGEHPHRGFETVTIAYQGEVEHHDSAGNHGVIGPGDVQWMTAASGVLHEEYHSSEFAKHGGKFEMIQLWVNLPAEYKMTPPKYQSIEKATIPVVSLPEGGSLRVIAGDYHGTQGPAETFTPVNLWEINLEAGQRTELTVPTGYTTLLFIRSGEIEINGEQTAGEADLAVFNLEGDQILIEAKTKASLMLLNGEPIDEPIAGYGPFVMNTETEIREAINDFRGGRFGAKAVR